MFQTQLNTWETREKNNL